MTTNKHLSINIVNTGIQLSYYHNMKQTHNKSKKGVFKGFYASFTIFIKVVCGIVFFIVSNKSKFTYT
jgi:hypothetical protein